MKRSRITISIDSEILDWINSQVKAGVYYNKSHTFEKVMKDHIKNLK